jgi:hypothetical protein
MAFVGIVSSVGFFGYIIYLIATGRRDTGLFYAVLDIWVFLGFILIGIVYFMRKKQLRENSEGLANVKQIFRKLLLVYGSAFLLILIFSLWKVVFK